MYPAIWRSRSNNRGGGGGGESRTSSGTMGAPSMAFGMGRRPRRVGTVDEDCVLSQLAALSAKVGWLSARTHNRSGGSAPQAGSRGCRQGQECSVRGKESRARGPSQLDKDSSSFALLKGRAGGSTMRSSFFAVCNLHGITWSGPKPRCRRSNRLARYISERGAAQHGRRAMWSVQELLVVSGHRIDDAVGRQRGG